MELGDECRTSASSRRRLHTVIGQPTYVKLRCLPHFRVRSFQQLWGRLVKGDFASYCWELGGTARCRHFILPFECLSIRSWAFRENPRACFGASGGAVCGAPWLQFGECARG